MSAASIVERAHEVRHRAAEAWFETVPDALTETERSILAAAALVGAMAEVLQIVVAHTSTREQFGAPLRSFQAVQSLLSQIAADTLASTAALDHALAVPTAAGAARAAKTQASFAAGRVAAAAHQAVGARGFTQEHPLGALTSLLLRVRDEHGDEFTGGLEHGRSLVDGGAPWAALVEEFAWDAVGPTKRTDAT